MSKRNFRRVAVIAGAAMAIGTMAPAMAARIDLGAGAGASVDPAGLVSDVTGSLPIDLPSLPSLTDADVLALTNVNFVNNLVLGDATSLLTPVLGTGLVLGGGALATAGGIAGGALATVGGIAGGAFGTVGGLGGDCGLVSVACGANVQAAVPVNASGVLAGGLHVLDSGVTTGDATAGIGAITATVGNITAPITAGVVAPVVANVSNVLNGNLLGGGLLGGGLGSILGVSGNVNIVSGLLASL